MGLVWKIVAVALGVVAAGVIALFVLFPDTIPESLSAWVPRPEVQDGPHFLLELDVDDLRRQRLATLREDVRRALREGRIAGTGVVVGNGIEVRLRDGVDRQQAIAKLNELLQPAVAGAGGPRSLEIGAGDGGVIRITQTEAAAAEQVRTAVADSVRITERRLADLGRTRPSVRQQGLTRILVRVSAGQDTKALIDVATRIGRLEFRLIDVSMTPEEALRGPPPESEVLYGTDKSPYLVEKRVLLSGRDVVDAQAGFDQRTNEPVVSFRFNASGTRRFAEVTQENVGRPFAIVLDNVVRSAPVIREPILGGSGQISGQFTVQQANEVALLLRARQLPARLTVVEE